MTESKGFTRVIKDEFTLEDVGSTLLENLAKGLYEVDEVIREYVQNAIDAHRLWKIRTGTAPEGPIQIEVRSDEITIMDYGIGMDETEVKKVKSISVSNKRNEEVRLTGHKGVGIWAGLSYFEKLQLTSTKQGSNKKYRLTIDFERVVAAIKDQADIGSAVNPNYRIEEGDADNGDHYTDVTLMHPRADVSDLFLDLDTVKGAVQRICPCEIDPDFVLHDQITAWYDMYGFELFPFMLNGKSVYRSYPGTVERFKAGTITSNDVTIAQFWHAVHKENDSLVPKGDQLSQFRVIQDGFALGRENLYSAVQWPGFTSLNTYTYLAWYIGEIHVILPDLRPDLPRRQFEEAEITRQFIERLRQWYKDLVYETRVLSDVRKHRKVYDAVEQRLEDLPGPLVLTEEDKVWLAKMLDELNKQDKQATPSKAAKAKESVGYQMAALRDNDVRTRRRRIIAQLMHLRAKIPDVPLASDAAMHRNTVIVPLTATAVFTDGLARPTTQAEQGGSGQAKRDSTGALPNLLPQTAGTAVLGGQDQEVGDDSISEPRVVAITVAENVLRDILTREFKEAEFRADAIVKRFLSYINSLSQGNA